MNATGGRLMATKEELIKAAEENARNYFRQGLNCAESVLKSFIDSGITDFPPEVVALSSGFGGGIARTKNACGAVLGACMAIGTVHGRKDPLAKTEMRDRVEELYGANGIYAFYRKFLDEVEEEYGSIVCSELSKGYDWEGKPRKRNCMGITTFCAGLAVKYALEER